VFTARYEQNPSTKLRRICCTGLRFAHSKSVFPLSALSESFHQRTVPYVSSYVFITNQIAGNLPNNKAVSAIDDRWIKQYIYFWKRLWTCRKTDY
jgi:hypothetical protein